MRSVYRLLLLGGVPFAVVGVMPKELALIATDLWIPWGADPAKNPRTARQFTLLARLAPGATIESANAELATIALQVPFGCWRLRSWELTDFSSRVS